MSQDLHSLDPQTTAGSRLKLAFVGKDKNICFQRDGTANVDSVHATQHVALQTPNGLPQYDRRQVAHSRIFNVRHEQRLELPVLRLGDLAFALKAAKVEIISGPVHP